MEQNGDNLYASQCYFLLFASIPEKNLREIVSFEPIVAFREGQLTAKSGLSVSLRNSGEQITGRV